MSRLLLSLVCVLLWANFSAFSTKKGMDVAQISRRDVSFASENRDYKVVALCDWARVSNPVQSGIELSFIAFLIVMRLSCCEITQLRLQYSLQYKGDVCHLTPAFHVQLYGRAVKCINLS